MNIYSTNYGVTVNCYKIENKYHLVIYKIPKYFLLVLQCIFPRKNVYGYHYQQLLIELKHCKIKKNLGTDFMHGSRNISQGKEGGGVVMETLFT